MYAKRAGIEGTISQGVRRSGLRRSRYLAKTHLGHIFTAAAINLLRVGEWLALPVLQLGSQGLLQ
jgi:transposase